MGNDAPLAVLSRNRKVVPEYFKQLFAQVRTHPTSSATQFGCIQHCQALLHTYLLVFSYISEYYVTLRGMQVTNPAIDPFRESVVTSLRTFIGPEGDLSEVSPEHCYRMELPQPVLSLRQMSALKRMDFRGWHANVIDTTFDKSLGDEGIQKTLRRVCQAAERAISWGYQILVSFFS